VLAELGEDVAIELALQKLNAGQVDTNGSRAGGR
jgi:hypothetical protein